MHSGKQLPVFVSVLLFLFFTACQKDVIVKPENELLQEGATSGDATVNEVIETSKPIHTPVTTYVNGNCAGYYQTLPARYGITTKNYPLIIFIHGIGELGTGVTRLDCCGIPYYAKRKLLPPAFTVGGATYSFIYISPQFKKRPTPYDVQSVINYAVKKYRVDRARIYVTGLSMGGGSALDYSVVYGQNITALAEACGGTKPTTSLASQLASKNIPLWGIYSTGDALVPEQWGMNWINWIKGSRPSNAANIKLTVYQGLSHNSTWSKAFNPLSRTDGYNIYEWLLRYKKGSVAAPVPGTGTSSGNKIPIASAGPNQTIDLSYRSNVFLNGPGSNDPDGWLTKYVWTKVSGPSVSIVPDGAKALTAAHGNNLVTGIYVFRLTVTDNDGATAHDDVTITVKKSGVSSSGPVASPPPVSSPGNKPPVANAGNDQTVWLSYRKNVFLNGPASRDPDGWLAKYTWSKVSGPAASIVGGGPNAVTSAHGNYLVVGTYVFRLTVTDNQGATDYDDVTVVVKK